MVVRFGNDDSNDGPDGEDTNFIVRAKDRDDAARVVDEILLNVLSHKNVEPYCHQIVEIGTDNGKHQDTAIIFGPCYAFAKINNYGYKVWERNSDSIDKWIQTIPIQK